MLLMQSAFVHSNGSVLGDMVEAQNVNGEGAMNGDFVKGSRKGGRRPPPMSMSTVASGHMPGAADQPPSTRESSSRSKSKHITLMPSWSDGVAGSNTPKNSVGPTGGPEAFALLASQEKALQEQSIGCTRRAGSADRRRDADHLLLAHGEPAEEEPGAAHARPHLGNVGYYFHMESGRTVVVWGEFTDEGRYIRLRGQEKVCSGVTEFIAVAKRVLAESPSFSDKTPPIETLLVSVSDDNE